VLKLLFAGSPAIAVPALLSLAALEREGICSVAGVLTNPDSAKGRSGKQEPTPVGAAAARFGIPSGVILKPARLDAAARDAAAAAGADMLVTFAYGHIFGPKFLALFPRGGINIHPSLLPKYRGPTPVQAAIRAGDGETGVSIQYLAPEMDAGDILVQEIIPLSGRETAETLSEQAADKGAHMLAALIRRFASGEPVMARPQTGAARYCALIAREDGLIDWAQSAVAIDRQIRAFTPWPLSWTWHGETELTVLEGAPCTVETAPNMAAPNLAMPGTVLGVDRERGILIQTGSGVFAAGRLQYRARKALHWKDFLNGAKDFLGSRLGKY
jgi:methionyl-tRNA formyltransferase